MCNPKFELNGVTMLTIAHTARMDSTVQCETVGDIEMLVTANTGHGELSKRDVSVYLALY